MSQKIKTYRYKLDESSRKFKCPNCGKKRFVRFQDFETEDYLPEEFGRCDREVNCGYFLNPYEDGFASESDSNWRESDHQALEPPPIDSIHYEVFKGSLRAYNKNRFIAYLRTLFDNEIVSRLIKQYYIGSSKHWRGSTVFWQIDFHRKVRTGKVMLYDASGRRIKTPYPHINWVHSLLYDDYNLEQCLFGEHLLTDDKSIPIAVVESEKTAIISSAYFPEFIWLATGAIHNLKPERCQSLMGRRVVLFPDLGAYNDWQQKANDLSYFCDISVSEMLEKYADTEAKKEGYDLADYLIQHEYEHFKND